MDGDSGNALPSQGINIQIPHRNIDRYHDDDFYGMSSTPPAVYREPPKFTFRKSKFYSLLGTEHAPTIPEEGTVETVSDIWNKKQITTSEQNNKGLFKSSSSPSLNNLESESNKITGEIMKQEMKALITGRPEYDIPAPHSSIDSEPTSSSVLKMFEKAHRWNYSDELKLKDLKISPKEVEAPQSQSVPGSPHTSPTRRRRNLSGDKIVSPPKASLTSTVMEHFTGSGLPKTGQYENKPMSSIKSLYQWSSTTKVKVDKRDMNMFAPTSF